jgi:hypothetical protein
MDSNERSPIPAFHNGVERELLALEGQKLQQPVSQIKYLVFPSIGSPSNQKPCSISFSDSSHNENQNKKTNFLKFYQNQLIYD